MNFHRSGCFRLNNFPAKVLLKNRLFCVAERQQIFSWENSICGGWWCMSQEEEEEVNSGSVHQGKPFRHNAILPLNTYCHFGNVANLHIKFGTVWNGATRKTERVSWRQSTIDGCHFVGNIRLITYSIPSLYFYGLPFPLSFLSTVLLGMKLIFSPNRCLNLITEMRVNVCVGSEASYQQFHWQSAIGISN